MTLHGPIPSPSDQSSLRQQGVSAPAAGPVEAPPAATPRFSPDDGLLLQSLFALSKDLFTLAQRSGRPLHSLLDWLLQPHIQAAILALDALEASGLKSSACATLRSLSLASPDPVERRRAATELLRNLRPTPARAPGGTALQSGVPSPPTTAAPAHTPRPATHTPGSPPQQKTTPSRSDDPPSPPGRGAAAHAAAERATTPPSPPASSTPQESPPRSGDPSPAPLAPSTPRHLETFPELDTSTPRHLDTFPDSELAPSTPRHLDTFSECDAADDAALDAEIDAQTDAEAEEFAHIPTDQLLAMAQAALADHFAHSRRSPPLFPSGP